MSESKELQFVKWAGKASEYRGEQLERERIIALLETALANHTKVLELRPTRSDSDVRHTICRTYQEAIALIKGENKHTHELEVFGAPCLGGDYHEYCLKCGWVEPCEIDGESN